MFNLSTQRSGSLDVYATSAVGHFAFRIATFAPSSAVTYNETAFNMTYDNNDNDDDANATMAFTTEFVCVPRDSYKLAFVASAMYSAIEDLEQPDVVIKDVVLTGTPCTAPALPGK